MADGRAAVHAALIEARKVKPSISEMRIAARDEAARIETVQAGLIDCGARVDSDREQIRALAVWDAIERVLQLFERHEAAVRSLLQQLQQRDATR
ncbi:hypothetical protein [Hansschlegelia sp.]|uniref:hypothetical protein n=1 Tax=Hansschlegelia sp. TaxID=2041892 RepID=UPI002BBA4A58|nr:hypothetical protein [Hansschlegelia sp.]HVI30440.1 hypothetical protein [Hansschlegelia sp.]